MLRQRVCPCKIDIKFSNGFTASMVIHLGGVMNHFLVVAVILVLLGCAGLIFLRARDIQERKKNEEASLSPHELGSATHKAQQCDGYSAGTFYW